MTSQRKGGRRDSEARLQPHRTAPSDAELLALFERQPEDAWPIFLDRYTPLLLEQLRRLGFDHDETMDRFVYVCEKLAEQRCRRLRSVRHLGQDGELTPWLREVVGRLAISWAWSTAGRRRLPRAIERLPAGDQRVFQLHFWDGLMPTEIRQRLHVERNAEVRLPDVLEALDRVIAALSANKLWRLIAGLTRRRGPISLDDAWLDGRPKREPAAGAANPERSLLRAEAEAHLGAALAALEPRERLVVQLRCEEGRAWKDIAAMMATRPKQAQRLYARALGRLRASHG